MVLMKNAKKILTCFIAKYNSCTIFELKKQYTSLRSVISTHIYSIQYIINVGSITLA